MLLLLLLLMLPLVVSISSFVICEWCNRWFDIQYYYNRKLKILIRRRLPFMNSWHTQRQRDDTKESEWHGPWFRVKSLNSCLQETHAYYYYYYYFIIYFSGAVLAKVFVSARTWKLFFFRQSSEFFSEFLDLFFFPWILFMFSCILTIVMGFLIYDSHVSPNLFMYRIHENLVFRHEFSTTFDMTFGEHVESKSSVRHNRII